MRLEENPQLPLGEAWRFTLTRYLRLVFSKVNALADGRLSAIDNAMPSFPTTGQYAIGDFVRNSQPAVLGLAGNQYVIYGWICVVSGPPMVWAECRFMTGT